MEKQTEKTFELKNKSLQIYDDGRGYINLFRYYHAYFNEIPNIIKTHDMNLSKVTNHINEQYKEEIDFINYALEYNAKEKRNIFEDRFFIFKNGLVVNLYNDSFYLLFKKELLEYAEQFQKSLLQFAISKSTEKTKNIGLIISNMSGLTTSYVNIKKPRLNLELHYNSDFKKIHDKILQNTKAKNKQGLYLLHGKPGTGKSTYIKHLILQQTKKVIFLSPNIAGNLDQFSLTKYLIDCPNSILVIEDAEDLIISRDKTENSRLSFLLNLTDGILGESLGIQIIATFNSDLNNIDSALLRKGRLTAIYEFKELEIDKTNQLLKKLNQNVTVNKPMTLANIFNYEIETNYQPILRTAVGFNNLI